MKAAFVVTWSGLVPGREKKAIEFFHEFNDFFAKYVAEGKIAEPEWLVNPCCRFFFVKGDYETLLNLQALPKFQQLVFAGDYLTEGFEYCVGPYGAEEFFKSFEEAGAKLGYV